MATNTKPCASEPDPWLVARKTAACALDSRRNTVYSPACTLECLRALSLGAAGSTEKELKEILGGDLPEGDWPGLDQCPEWSYGDYAGRILTGVWLDESAKPEKGFEVDCEQSGITVADTDFSSPGAGAEISRWISDATDGFVSPRIDLDPLALVCVSSVLYLRDAWQEPFSKRGTRRRPFHAADGDIKADYMMGELTLHVADVEGAGTFAALPLSNGATMELLLPEAGCSLSDVLGDRRTFDLVAMPRTEEALVDLRLPKFICDSTVDNMADVLSAVGLTTASTPDLSRMTGASEVPVSYSHGAKVSVDENGLEAGAYFAVTLCAGVPGLDEVLPKPRVIAFDRPFLYFIVSRTGQPLFIGTVARPEADGLAWVSVASEEEKGSEEGLIIENEEIPGVCRITLEEDCRIAPYGITCGVYVS